LDTINNQDDLQAIAHKIEYPNNDKRNKTTNENKDNFTFLDEEEKKMFPIHVTIIFIKNQWLETTQKFVFQQM